MDNNQYIIRSKDELGAAAAWLIKQAGARRVVAFDAPMGAGKTTLISEMTRLLADSGIYDYLDSGSWCLLEWPQVAVDFLPADTVVVRIEVLPDGERVLTVVS